MITLYGYPTSPYVQKLKCVLDFKGLDYAFAPVTPGVKTQLAFTGERRTVTVPVLKIDDEWRTDSSALARWLDERFPERRVTGADQTERDAIAKEDAWVSRSLIPSVFRGARDWSRPVTAFSNAWRLAAIVDAATPIPSVWRALWPVALKRAAFIANILDDSDLDLSQSGDAIARTLAADFVARLRDGDFLGGRDRPSLADLAAYPPIAFKRRCGFRGVHTAWSRPEIEAWRARLEALLPANPFPVADRFLRA